MVYVLAKNGRPLMPTENHGYVRILLKSHRAVVVRKNPFTIRLKVKTTTYTQPLVCGIDPGRTNIGVAVATEDGKCVFSANADTCNKDVPKRMAEKKLTVWHPAAESGSVVRDGRKMLVPVLLNGNGFFLAAKNLSPAKSSKIAKLASITGNEMKDGSRLRQTIFSCVT